MRSTLDGWAVYCAEHARANRAVGLTRQVDLHARHSFAILGPWNISSSLSDSSPPPSLGAIYVRSCAGVLSQQEDCERGCCSVGCPERARRAVRTIVQMYVVLKGGVWHTDDTEIRSRLSSTQSTPSLTACLFRYLNKSYCKHLLTPSTKFADLRGLVIEPGLPSQHTAITATRKEGEAVHDNELHCSAGEGLIENRRVQWQEGRINELHLTF